MNRLHRVSVRNVSRLFGATLALRGVSLELQAGSLSFLTGENGAGKSTLLHLLGTRLSPSSGSIGFLNEENQELSLLELRAQLGWVSHESLLYRELTGRQNLEFYCSLWGTPPGALASLSERLELGSWLNRPVSTLSRGQKQKASLARALLHRPQLLLLDEPWTGLDSAAQNLLDRVAQEEAQAGHIVVVVSHERGHAARLGAQEFRLQQGRLLASS